MHVCPIAGRQVAELLPGKGEGKRVDRGGEEGDGVEVGSVRRADVEVPNSPFVAQFDGMKSWHTGAENGLVEAVETCAQVEALPAI